MPTNEIDFPEWFDINKYSEYNPSTNLNEYVHQLSKRTQILSCLKDNTFNFHLMMGIKINGQDSLVKSRKFIDIESLLLSLSTMDEERLVPSLEYTPATLPPLTINKEPSEIIGQKILPEGNVISPFSVKDAKYYHQIIENNQEHISQINIDDFDKYSFSEKNNIRSQLDSFRHIDILDKNTKSVSLRIDLDKVSNDMIIEDLKLLLPKYREILNIQKETEKLSKRIYKKLHDYHALQILDLEIWMAMYGKTITRSVIIEKLELSIKVDESLLGKHRIYIFKHTDVKYFDLPNT